MILKKAKYQSVQPRVCHRVPVCAKIQRRSFQFNYTADLTEYLVFTVCVLLMLCMRSEPHPTELEATVTS